MPSDSRATKERILRAAAREFAQFGLAGARVDRIAEAASANKRAIYSYFGNKDELFDIVLLDKLKLGTEAVPATWDDLPAYAGRLFDYFNDDPDRLRLNAWRQLERPLAVPHETEIFRAMLSKMHAARFPGETLPAPDLYAMIFALHHAWMLAPAALWEASGEDPSQPEVRARQREAAIEAVRRLMTPSVD